MLSDKPRLRDKSGWIHSREIKMIYRKDSRDSWNVNNDFIRASASSQHYRSISIFCHEIDFLTIYLKLWRCRDNLSGRLVPCRCFDRNVKCTFKLIRSKCWGNVQILRSLRVRGPVVDTAWKQDGSVGIRLFLITLYMDVILIRSSHFSELLKKFA